MNKLVEVRDAGDSYIVSTRLYMSVALSKVALDNARADIINLEMEKLHGEVTRAFSAAVLQVPGVIADLRRAAGEAA